MCRDSVLFVFYLCIMLVILFYYIFWEGGNVYVNLSSRWKFALFAFWLIYSSFIDHGPLTNKIIK